MWPGISEMAFPGEASSAVDWEKGVRSLLTLGGGFGGEASGGRGMDAWGPPGQHTGVGPRHPHSLPLQPRHACLLSDSETKSQQTKDLFMNPRQVP